MESAIVCEREDPGEDDGGTGKCQVPDSDVSTEVYNRPARALTPRGKALHSYARHTLAKRWGLFSISGSSVLCASLSHVRRDRRCKGRSVHLLVAAGSATLVGMTSLSCDEGSTTFRSRLRSERRRGPEIMYICNNTPCGPRRDSDMCALLPLQELIDPDRTHCE